MGIPRLKDGLSFLNPDLTYCFSYYVLCVLSNVHNNLSLDFLSTKFLIQALVRKADQQVMDMLPTSVKIVIGDVGDPSSLKAAVKGCNKIIYCATARSSITGDLNRVDYQGVSNLTKAFQVSLLTHIVYYQSL